MKTGWTNTLRKEESALIEQKKRRPSDDGHMERSEEGGTSDNEIKEEASDEKVCKPFVAYEVSEVEFRRVEGLEFEENKVEVKGEEEDFQKLSMLLYPLESLRKREGGEEKVEADE